MINAFVTEVFAGVFLGMVAILFMEITCKHRSFLGSQVVKLCRFLGVATTQHLLSHVDPQRPKSHEIPVTVEPPNVITIPASEVRNMKHKRAGYFPSGERSVKRMLRQLGQTIDSWASEASGSRYATHQAQKLHDHQARMGIMHDHDHANLYTQKAHDRLAAFCDPNDPHLWRYCPDRTEDFAPDFPHGSGR